MAQDDEQNDGTEQALTVDDEYDDGDAGQPQFEQPTNQFELPPRLKTLHNLVIQYAARGTITRTTTLEVYR